MSSYHIHYLPVRKNRSWLHPGHLKHITSLGISSMTCTPEKWIIYNIFSLIIIPWKLLLTSQMALWVGPEMVIRTTLLNMFGWKRAFELFSPQFNLILWFLHHIICTIKLGREKQQMTCWVRNPSVKKLRHKDQYKLTHNVYHRQLRMGNRKANEGCAS